MFAGAVDTAVDAGALAAVEAAIVGAALLGAEVADDPEEQAARPSAETETRAMDAAIFMGEVMGEG